MLFEHSGIEMQGTPLLGGKTRGWAAAKLAQTFLGGVSRVDGGRLSGATGQVDTSNAQNAHTTDQDEEIANANGARVLCSPVLKAWAGVVDARVCQL